MNCLSPNELFSSPTLESVMSFAKEKPARADQQTLQLLETLTDEDGRINRFKIIRQNDGAIRFGLDLSSLPGLPIESARSPHCLPLNNLAVAKLVKLFDKLAKEAGRRQTRATGEKIKGFISSIDLSDNLVSGRSLLEFELVEGPQEKQSDVQTRLKRRILNKLEELKMDRTLISSLGLQFAALMPSLRSLSLDFCSRIDKILTPECTGMPKLEELSAVGTSVTVGASEMEGLAIKFPNLRRIDYTQKPSSTGKPQKVLGITDPITFSTVIDPQIFSCGHLTGRREAEGMGDCYSHCSATVIDSFKPLTTRLEKKSGLWEVQLIDFKRRPLSEKIFYHIPCGALFNQETVDEIYQGAEIQSSSSFSNALVHCPACLASPVVGRKVLLALFRIFPELTPRDSQESSQSMSSLHQQSTYIFIGN